MKKYLLLYVLAIMLCLSACSAPLSNSETTANTTPTTSTSLSDTQPESESTEPAETEPEPGYFPIPEEPLDFTYLSGAGGWRSVLSINRDGTFSGRYEDSEAGSIGEDYPNGTVYICDFSGVFTDIEKVNKYTYKATAFGVTTHQEPGKEWIKDDIRYIAANPAGIYDEETSQMCEEFIVYLPDTPINEVPAEFLTWWPYYGGEKTTLSCYGILNVATNAGFFYIP